MKETYRILKVPKYQKGFVYRVEALLDPDCDFWCVCGEFDTFEQAEKNINEMKRKDSFYENNKPEVIKIYR